MMSQAMNQVIGTGFWSMGGYARYVWPCFGFTFFILAWNLWSARQLFEASKVRVARTQAMAAGERS